jgi:hypothetical protein
MTTKVYLDFENNRNQVAHRAIIRFLKRAIGPDVQVVIAHHIVFMQPGKLPNEIPSADTMWFDPEIMGKVFGDQAPLIMQTLANRTPDLRDKVAEDFLDNLDIRDPAGKFEFQT